MTDNAKQLYNELSKRGRFFDTEEAFEKELQTEEGAKFYYDVASKEGLWMDTFEGFKSDIFGDEQSKEESEDGLVKRAINYIQKAQPFAHNIEENKKEAEEEAARQVRISTGLTEKDKNDMAELASLQKKAASPVVVDESGIFHAPEPVYDQYGMPIGMTKPTNPELEKQIAAKKAQMSSYLTRGEENLESIQANAIERALGTEDGKKLQTTIYNKYVDEFKNSEAYKTMMNDFYAGKATEDDIKTLFLETYGSKVNGEFYSAIASNGGMMHDYIIDAENKLKTKLAAEDAYGLKREVDEAKEEQSKQYATEYNEKYKKAFGVYPDEDPLRDLHAKGFSVSGAHINPPAEGNLAYASQFNDKALTLIDAVNNDKGFFGGLGDAVTDMDTWDLGLGEIARSTSLMNVLDKVEKDEELTKDEQLMFDAALNYFAVSAYYSDKVGRGYKAGQTTGASLPFMIQFLVSSGTTAAIDGALKAGANAVTKKIVKAMIKGGQKKLAKVVASDASKMVGKAIGGAVVSGIDAALLTSTFGIGKIEAGTLQREIGQVRTDFDSRTNQLKYEGRDNQQTREEARKNAIIDTYVEYFSEMALSNTLSPVGSYLSGTKMFKDIAKGDVVGTLVDIWNNPVWKSIRKSTKFGSLPEEVLEEELGGLLRLAASDVNTAKEAGLDLDSQIDIVLGLAPTSIFFGGVGAASHYGKLWAGKREFRASLTTEEEKQLFDKLMKESRSGQFGDLAHDLIRTIVQDTHMSQEQKKKSISTIVSKYHDLLSEEAQKLADQVTVEGNERIIDDYISQARYGASDNIYQTIDNHGRVVVISDGKIEFNRVRVGQGYYLVVDPNKSEGKVKVRYVNNNGTLTDEIDINVADLTAPVTELGVDEFKRFKLAQSNAVSSDQEAFEFEDGMYNTSTGEYIDTKEAYEKKKAEEAANRAPIVETKAHKVNETVTITINGEKKAVRIISGNLTQNEDGSIKGGTISISVDGSPVTGERKKAIISQISDLFKAEHANAVEEFNQRQAAENAPVEATPIVSDEDKAVAETEAQREAEKQSILASAQEKKAKKYTPEEAVVVLMEQGNDVATRLVGSRINKLRTQIDEINADENKDELEKWEDSKELSDQLAAYEAAVAKWLGQESLDEINAARTAATQAAVTTPVQGEAPTAPVQAPVVEQGETPADAPAGPDTIPLPLPDVAPNLEETGGEEDGDGETPAPDTLGEEGGVEGNEEGKEPAPAADKPTANLDEVTVWVAKNYDYIVTDKEGNTIFSSNPTRKKVTDVFEELHQVEGKVDGKRGTYNGEDCIIVRDNPAKGYVNIVTPHGIERVGREEVIIDGKPLKGKVSLVEWRENNEKNYTSFESIMKFPVFDIRGEMNITFLDFLNTQQDSPYVAFYEMLRKHYREKYNDDVAQQYLDASVARLIKNLKEVARLWNIVRTKRLISSGQMPTTLERKKMGSQSKRMKEAVAAVHNAVGLDNSIDFSGLAELSEKAAKKAEKKGEGEGYFAETDEEKAESYVDGLVSNILWVGFESENKHEHEDAVEGIAEALNKESKKASKLRELVVNILSDRLEEAKRLNRLNDIQAIERVIDRLSRLKKMKPILTEAGLIEEKGNKDAPAKPAPKKDTSKLVEQLSLEENSLRDMEEEYKTTTDAEEKSELEGYIAQAKEKIAKLKAEIDGAEFMVGQEPTHPLTEAEDLSLSAALQSAEESLEDGSIVQISFERANEEVRRNNGTEASISDTGQTMFFIQTDGKTEVGPANMIGENSVVLGYAKNGKIYLTPAGMNANTVIHEYTHIWAKALQQQNPKAWKSIVDTLKKCKELWNEVLNDPNYDSIKNDENAVASEVLSRYSGKRGAERLNADAKRVIAEKKGMEKDIKVKALIDRVRKALTEFWSWVGKNLFEIESFSNIDEIADRTLFDMLNNTKLNLDNSKKSSTFAQNNENYERNDERTMDGEVPSGSRRGESRTDSNNGEGRRLPVRDVPRANGGYDANVAQSVAEQSRLLSKMLTERGIKHTSQQVKLATPQEFYDAIIEAKQLNPHGWMVDAYKAEDYAGFTCLLTEDGKSGIAIKPNGDIISVFSSVKRDNRLQMLMPMAIMQGGRKLDCYYLQGENGNIYGLPKLYSTFGFKIAATTNFVEEYVPQDEYARWREDNNGSSIQGVAAMYISDEVANDLINSYSISATPNTNAQNFPSADSGYGEALANRDKLMILENARANGTIGTINGKKSNLPDELWAVVRTDAFKDWFGDWQNDPANASKVLDENGEPLVVYHGSRMAGFDKFGRGEARDSQGVYTTSNRRAAESYATSNEEWKLGQTMPEAELGVPDHHGVYSLFVNMRNPKVIDFEGKEFDRFGEPKYEVATNEALDNGERGIMFDTLEEAEAYIAEHPEEDLDYVDKYTTSDDMLLQAKEEGYDGVIFTNIIDSRYPAPITNYVPFEPNQVKSATQNIGTFDAKDDRIEFMVGPAPSSSTPTDPAVFDTAAANRLIVKTQKYLAKVANPNVELPEEFSALRKFIAEAFDRTEGIRWMMNSIEEYRRKHGMPELGEGFDVRTMVETMESKVQNETKTYIRNIENKLRNNIHKLAKRLEGTSFYKKYKTEKIKNQSGEYTVLTPVQLIERYLIARDSIEREELTGNPRGAADFYQRMGVDMVEFVKGFHSALFPTAEKKKELDELWDSVRAATDVVIDRGWESGLISYDEYQDYKKRKFYVPERDFAEVETNEDIAVEELSYHGRGSNKLAAMKQAKGGESLAASVLANICLLARDAILKANKNIVKKSMYDLLRANADWCREYHIPIPHQIWYVKNPDGSVTRMTDGPTAEQKKQMREIKSDIRKLEDEIRSLTALRDGATVQSVKDAYDADIKDLEDEIEMLRGMMPYLDEYDTRNQIFLDGETRSASTVVVYVDGVPTEMLFPNMSIVAKALNGTFNKEGKLERVEKWKNASSAAMTVYNPAFFTVNVVRDIPFIMTKGFAEYGVMFPIRFIAELGKKLLTLDLWKVAWTGDATSIKNEHLKAFYEGGANTGYTSTPDLKKLKDATKGWDKNTAITLSNVGDVISYLNTFSEVWTRAAAYSVVRQMGRSNEEGLRAAKNLSVNFNRKGLGNKFMNAFGSISLFMNAAIQGSCGWLRAFSGNEKSFAGKALHATRAALGFMFAPAFAGFIDTLCNPDDDENLKWYSDYDRDNYCLFGDVRIPLNEQIKPFWGIGVNIALAMQGRRNTEQLIDSIVSSIFTNLVPLPPVINESIVMAVNGVTGAKDIDLFDIPANLITPQAIGGVYDLANGVNFMGSKLEFDTGDKPQFIFSENEALTSRLLAKAMYYLGFGSKVVKSKTRDNGKEILFDVNPKQVTALRSLVPAGSTFKDIVEFMLRGIVEKDFGSPEDYATIRRFYKPREEEIAMYNIIKEAKAIVKRNSEIKANMKAQLKGGEISGNEAMSAEAKRRYVNAMSDADIKEMQAYIKAYEVHSVAKRAREFGLTEEEFLNSLPEDTKKMIKDIDTRRPEIARKLLTMVRDYKDIEVNNMTLEQGLGLEE